MREASWLLLFFLTAVLLGCDYPASGPIAESMHQRTSGMGAQPLQPISPLGKATPEADVPDQYRAVSELLMAFHAEDLPDREALAHHPEAEDALIWLSDHGEPIVVRQRALSALGNIGTARAMNVLDAHAAAKDSPPGLRAAALDGMRAWSVEDIEARGPLLRASMADQDPRVAISAARTAVLVEALAGEVARCGDSHPSPAVREAVRQVLVRQ